MIGIFRIATTASLDILTEVGAQGERAVVVQLLVTSPAHGIAHCFYFDRSSKFQSFPILDIRQHKLCLPNLARQGIASVQTTALKHLSVLCLHGHPQYARHTRDAIIGKTDDQPQVIAILVAPDKRRPHAITNLTIDPVKGCRISLIVGRQIFCADLVEVPKRPVVRPDIDYMSDHVLCWRDTFMRGTWIGRLARNPLLEQCGGPRRTIAERLNLLVLDKNGIAANPVVAADRAV